MTPDDLLAVRRSWAALQGCTPAVIDGMAAHLPLDSRADAEQRAAWVVDAVDGMVDLLDEPSKLAAHARAMAPTWPDCCNAPSPQVEGAAFIAAASALVPWSESLAEGWRHAWLLMIDVLAAEILSPFRASRDA